jgi:hypothetical protein
VGSNRSQKAHRQPTASAARHATEAAGVRVLKLLELEFRVAGAAVSLDL